MRKKRYYPIKGYPNYTITVTGKIHKLEFGVPAGVLVKTWKGPDGKLQVDLRNAKGELVRESVEELMDSSLPLRTHVRPTLAKNIDTTEFRTIAKDPEYEINRLGAVRRKSDGKFMVSHMLRDKPTPVYFFGKKIRYINGLLYDTFGVGAASQAGFEECRRAVVAAKKERGVR